MRARSSVIVHAVYPVDFPVHAKGTLAPYRAVAISERAVAMHGCGALEPDHVATLTLRAEYAKTPSMILATVRACRPCAGGYLITAEPFALSAADREEWSRIVTSAAHVAKTDEGADHETLAS